MKDMSELQPATPPASGDTELLSSVQNEQQQEKGTHKKTKAIKKSNKKPKAPADGTITKPTPDFVDHTYTDFAIVEDDDLRLLDENSSLLPAPASDSEAIARQKLGAMSCTFGPMKKHAGGVVQPFPGKLLEVLDRSDLVDGIDWMPHGRAFIVKKTKLFTTNILPRFFKQTKFLSFTRQLNLWGFKRITRGVDSGAYYHALFLRGRPYLATRMKRQKIKGTGMKLTPNPDEEPNFYKDWPAMPRLNVRRVVPPLPPLPAERLGLQAGGPSDRASRNMLNALQQQQSDQGMHGKKQVGGAATMDRVSENMLNALKFGSATRGGFADNMSSFLRPNTNGFSTLSNQMHGYGSQNHSNSSMSAFNQGHGGQRYPGTNQGNTYGYDDLLLAPGVSPLDDASRLSQQSSNHDISGWNAGTGGLSQNDPLQDELSAMIANRGQQAVNASSMVNMYPPQQLSSDRLLMERLRDLDRAQQVKREQQDMSMLRRARLFDDLASCGAGVTPPGAAATGVHTPTHAVGPNVSNGLSQGPFDRFSFPPPQIPAPSLTPQAAERSSSGSDSSKETPPPSQDPFATYENAPVESSVKDALRVANHLEELALAQRAKARSLALAGALQSRFGEGEQQQQQTTPKLKDQQQKMPQLTDSIGKETSLTTGAAAGSRPSFGRPFGRKD